jgi:phospholipid/cholesterol/gamma-HCH transport system substrate-binding protein
MSRAFRLGVFIVVGTFLFGVAIFWIGSEQKLWGGKYQLSAEFQNVAGLQPGAEVRVAGLSEGTVKRIDLPKKTGGKVRIEMSLNTASRRVIKADSQAVIRAEGLMGDEYVEVSMGSEQVPEVKDNSTLQGESPVEVSDIIKKVDGLLDQANGAVQNVTQATGNIDSITAKVNNGAGSMGALVNDKGVYQNINKASSEMQEDAEALKHNFLLSHFFHNRGYEDSADLTKYEIKELPPDPPSKQFSWKGPQIFDKTDTAKLKNEKVLNDAGKYLAANPFGLAVLEGFSDMKGDASTEQVLTEARALVVREYLVKNFKMDDTKVKTIGIGKSIDANDAGVSLLIYPPGAYSVISAATPPAPPTHRTSDSALGR